MRGLYTIAKRYNGPPEAAHTHIYVDRWDLVQCVAGGKPELVFSDQPRGCSVTVTVEFV